MAQQTLAVVRTELKDFELFSRVDRAVLDHIAAVSQQRRLPAGQLLVQQGAPGDSVFLIMSGSFISVLWTMDGREIAFRTLNPGAVVGELAVISGGSRSLSLYAHTDSVVTEIPGQEFLQLIDQHPPIRTALMRSMVRMIRDLTERVHELRTLRVEDRLRAYLLRTALDQGPLIPQMMLQHVHSHAQIGDMIGANREAVTRSLATLKTDGVIEYGRGFIRIIQPEALMVGNLQ